LKRIENLEMLYPGKSMEDIKDLIISARKGYKFYGKLVHGTRRKFRTTNNLL
jgi:hypothetical protein